MKLKEKLGRSYSEERNGTDIPGVIRSEMEAFIAGFDAAREMAIPIAVIYSEAGHEDLKLALSEIGEEEVE